jgi:hypothetical protein
MRGVVVLIWGRKLSGFSVQIILEIHLNPVVHLRL